MPRETSQGRLGLYPASTEHLVPQAGVSLELSCFFQFFIFFNLNVPSLSSNTQDL